MPTATVSSSYKPHATSSVAPRSAAATVGATTATRSLWDRTFSNGDTYHGEALYVHDADRKPVKDGRGRYTWASSGASYDGDWKGGLPHGTGVMSVPGVDGYEYVGEFKDGKRSGKGRCQFTNGRVYEGEWREDEMNGTGTLRGASNLDDFTEYTGSFQSGIRSGPQGRCVYANGDVYDGSWAAGKRQGSGEWWLHRSGTGAAAAARPLRYRGAFDRDAPQASSVAEAEIEYADGSLYTGGTDAQMRRHGKGVHRLSSGDVFEGLFAQDRREGQGVLQGSDGTVCEGPWHHDQLNGDVRITFANPSSSFASASSCAASAGSPRGAASASIASLLRLSQPEHAAHPMKMYHGPCVAGILTGSPAAITYIDGSTYNGAVRNGAPHGTGVLRERPLPRATGADGIDADGAVRNRIPLACVPAEVLLRLTCYEGTFSNGEADGNGIGEWRTGCSTQNASSASALPREVPATPHNFIRALEAGLRCWAPAMYGHLDGAYTGQWARGLPHGQGTWQWLDGSRYTGEVAHYVPSRAGTLSACSVHYKGDLREGQAEGTGIWEDKARGLRYEGQWLAGQPHGSGVATLLSVALPPPPQASPSIFTVLSCAYEGAWANGKPSGPGKEYTSVDRRHVVYQGEYVDGFREGEGTIFFDGADEASRDSALQAKSATPPPPFLKYKGTFRKSVPGGGPGCLTLRNKTTIEGCFDEQLLPLAGGDVVVKSGNAMWTFKGVYDAANHTGRGVMTFANGDVYDGEVEDASCGEGRQEQPLFNLQRHGRGVYKFVEGNKLCCTWRHNILHGAGTYTSADGVRTERSYADGVVSDDSVAANADGRCSSGAHVEADTGALNGNVFTPENEFPNTLSAEALRFRMPESQQEPQSHSRKRQPFSFMRKGEARLASAAGEAAAAGGDASPGTSSATAAQSTSPRYSSKDAKRPSVPLITSANQKRSSRTPVSGSAAPNRTGANGGGDGGDPLQAARHGSMPPKKKACPAVLPCQSMSKQCPRQPLRSGRNAPPLPATEPCLSVHSVSPTASVPSSARLSLPPHSKSDSGGFRASAQTSSAYLSKFQAGIRQMDIIARAESPNRSVESGSLTPPTRGSSHPVAVPVRTGSRGRLTSALEAGRARERQARVLKPLGGSLKALMDAASAIRNTREDEIHLLTEEMRALNERIWQLRFVLLSREEEHTGRGTGKAAYSKVAPMTEADRKRPSASKETLAALVEERRVIMEKLQYVMNEPD
ncbi:hypothetical protein JKF63_00499 [Porcisia hertigi]|uniref:Uncharacterized protein n=1 Tax=Porcisia hertigi TaxID=2761500 RepID=A0A836HD83_9TRYP|nr:hypothetical protein JKF63_00499 [Porcisia hertigi]